MYCKNCGKYIEYDAVYCDECKKILEDNDQKDHYFDDVNKPKQPTPEKKELEGSIKEGLKKGIIALVLAIVGAVFVGVAVAFISSFAEIYLADHLSLVIEDSIYMPTEFLPMIENVPYLSLILGGVSLPFSIIGLLYGIQSIKVFIKAKKEGRKRPFPTLILGIAATYESAFAILSLLEVIALFALMAII